MAKGQMRSTKEPKKPKKEQVKASATTGSGTAASTTKKK